MCTANGLQVFAKVWSTVHIWLAQALCILQGYGLYSSEFSFTMPPITGQPQPVTVCATF